MDSSRPSFVLLILAAAVACGPAGTDGTGNGVHGRSDASPNGSNGSGGALDGGAVSDLDGGRLDAGVQDLGSHGGPFEATIGPGGGEVGNDTIHLQVPAGALSEPTTIRLTVLAGPASSVGPVVNLMPSGLRFNEAASLTLPYERARIPAGASEEDIIAAYLEDETWVSSLETNLDPTNSKAVARVDHFSWVGLTVRTTRAVRLHNRSPIGNRLSNIVLDPSLPDYIVEPGDHPSTAFRGVIVTDVLTVEPGVRIAFEEDTALRVTGRLVARGTEDAPIIFEGAGGGPQAGHWRGLMFIPKRDAFDEDNVLEHVQIRHAGRPWTEQNPRSRISSSITLGTHDPGFADVAELKVIQSMIEDGRGHGIDVVQTEASFWPGAFQVSKTTFRRIEGFPMALWPRAVSGLADDNVYADNGEARLWLRGAEVFEYTVQNLGIPILYGLTRQEQEDYPGFTPERSLQVWLGMQVEAGAELQFKPGTGIVLIRSGENSETSSLRTNGTEERPVVLRSSAAERWAGISVRSSNRDTEVRHTVIENANTAVDVGFGNPSAYVRLVDTTIRNCGCGVRRIGTGPTTELERVVFDATPVQSCGD